MSAGVRPSATWLQRLGISAEDVRDLMVTSVEHRFGQVSRLLRPIEWLTDSGSCFTARDLVELSVQPVYHPCEAMWKSVNEHGDVDPQTFHAR